MSTDNPSYFAVASGTLPCSNKGKFRLFKKKMGTTTSQEAIAEASPLKNNAKMPLRTLLRSVSSNSADSNQELLVLGEPRPSDIAPPSPYLHSHREEPRSKGKKSKSNGEIVNNDLLYCPLATSEEAADEVDFSDGEEEEVFLTEDSAKYYNISASRETGRRHSVGTYLLQERDRALSVASSSKSYREDVPQSTVHATLEGDAVKPASVSSESELARSTRPSRRRCTRCNVKGAGCGSTCASGMDDILIVSSKGSHAASLWVQYFGNCFDQYSKQKERPPYKVFHLGIEDVNDGTGISPQLEQRVSSVKLQMVIVCPQLLEYVASEPRSSAALCNLLKSDRTIAMLLGVTDDDLTDVHHTALVSYRQWSRHQVGQDQDQDFARDFLASAVGIMTKVARQQHAAALEERTTFSIMPKKVKQSQNRLIVLLAEPLARDDTVRVSVDKNGELMEVKPVKRRNPYTLKFTMPDRCMEVSSIVNVLVEKNGNVLGARPVKCESRLRELDQILRTINDPVEFMCQTLGFSPSNSEQLDGWMVHSFQRNLPPHFNLVATTAAPGASRGSNRQSPARHPHGHEEYPTLLHFAARYGLERLAWQLLECPGGEAACDLRNACDMTPAEIAENAGHTKLASALRGYMQMNEFTNMYSQLKELSQTKQENAVTAAVVPTVTATPDVDEDEYLLPRSAELTYSIPPPARPYSPAAQPNANRPITGYLEMQPATKPYAGRTTPTTGRITPAHNNKHSGDQLSETSSKPATPLPPTETNEAGRTTVTAEQTYEDKVQGELLEIINDFKNNVFTLSEVEHLVENWRKRNDVQKSFKEKEEQLNSMRKEYERIQQVMKEEMKRATPFDRIKKLFSRGSRNKESERAPVANFSGAEDKSVGDGPATGGGQSHLRPISSLSLQSTASSSSSGRMSTLSGCSAASLGDSGTHSDHEDRKHLMRQTSSDHEYFEINDPKKNPGFNYLIPPTPKPVYKYNPLKQHSPVQQFSTITERPPQPAPNDRSTEGDEYYIQFPPSGLPVGASLAPPASEEASTEYLSVVEDIPLGYMNLPAPAADEEQLPEYMNFQPAAPPPSSPAPALPPRNC